MMRRNRKLEAFFLAGILAMGGSSAVISPLPVLADVSYRTGSITINAGQENADNDANSDVTYHGYLIFKANVTDDAAADGGKLESNIIWASDEMKKAVEEAIGKKYKADNAGAEYTGKTAQDAAEYIKKAFSKDFEKETDSYKEVNQGKGTRAGTDSFAWKLAKAVSSAANAENVTTVTSGQKTEGLAEGYWLFVTDPSSTKEKTGRTGTAPIFTVIGGSDTVVMEKTSIPTVTKMVKSDAKGKGSFGSTAVDSQMEQEVQYQLTGTVADNIAAFETYRYKFTDTLSAAMTPDMTEGDSATLHVYAVPAEGEKVELKRIAADATDAEKKTGYTAQYNADSNTLVIDFPDLKSVKQKEGDTAPAIDADVKIVVEYQAKLDSKKAAAHLVTGGNGNQNKVSITYSNNPFAEGTGISKEKTAADYSYALLLHKIDRTTETNLGGAKFTISASGPDEGISDGVKAQYVQADGSLGEKEYEFTTDKNGEIRVRGLDAGQYTVHETAAPDGYSAAADFTFEIIPTYEGETLTKLENQLTATDSVVAGSTDGDTSDTVMKAKSTDNDAADRTSGTVKITVGDVRKVKLPLTGQAGITAGVTAGGFLVVISGIALSKNRKEKKKA